MWELGVLFFFLVMIFGPALIHTTLCSGCWRCGHNRSYSTGYTSPDWPFIERDGKYFHRETGEEHEAVSFIEFLERTQEALKSDG